MRRGFLPAIAIVALVAPPAGRRRFLAASPVYVSASISDRGDAALAWQDSTRGPNGWFGVLDPMNSSLVKASLQVAVDATGGSVLSIAGSYPSYVWRPSGGS